MLRRALNFVTELHHARQTGAIPLGLTRSIQRGVQSYTYRGLPMMKHPMDMALYAELIWREKPSMIIEIGSGSGASALWMADMLRSYEYEGYVFSIDIKPPEPEFKDSRIKFIYGEAANLEPCFSGRSISSVHPILVIEDSSHLSSDTLAVLNFFAPHMQAGEYIIVEDGNVSDIGNAQAREGGPLKAIHQFLEENPEFAVDRSYCDRYGYNATANPDGYIKRMRYEQKWPNYD
jgi:cephalosporin hydroxylase